MTRIIFFTSLFLIFCFTTFGQTPYVSRFGSPTPIELTMTHYEKDTTAAVVILHHKGYYDFEIKKGKLRLIKNIYRKIKVFDSQNFDRNVDNILLKTSESEQEEFLGLNGYVYNNNTRKPISSDEVFPTYEEGVGTIIRLLVSNIQDGTIIEYSYSIESPFLLSLGSWYFQNEIPTLYSELITKIPVGINFNNSIYGSEKLDFHHVKYSRDCIQTIPNDYVPQCPIEVFAMKDVPAFKEEQFMLSPNNYVVRIMFEPESLIAFGQPRKSRFFSTKWEDVDKYFEKDASFGKRLKKNNFFKRRLPKSILAIEDDLERAKAVYSFIQNHYEWNGFFYYFGNEIKEVYDSKAGNAMEINVSLINALRAAKLDAELMMISTRENGLPTTVHPVLTQFNYGIVYLKIEDKIHLLDATNKKAPFGILPFYALNVQGRVMDFNKRSFWAPIKPYLHNTFFAKSSVKAQSDGTFKGNSKYHSSGYIALEKREMIENLGENGYTIEMEYTESSRELNDYVLENIHHVDQPLIESHSIAFTPEKKDDNFVLYPFFNNLYFKENPFSNDERQYPIELGFPFSNTYHLEIDLGDIYKVLEKPENKILNLPNDEGTCIVNYALNENVLSVQFSFSLHSHKFMPEVYPALKDFFEFAITALKKDVVLLKPKQD